MVLNFFITVIRIPLGIIASVAILLFWLLVFPLEFIALSIAMPFGVIFMKRAELKESWIGSFPNSLKQILKNLYTIWRWVIND